MKGYWQALVVVLIIVAGAFKMLYKKNYNVEDLYDEIERHQNAGVEKDKDASITEAVSDHDDAIAMPGNEWVDSWLRKRKR